MAIYNTGTGIELIIVQVAMTENDDIDNLLAEIDEVFAEDKVETGDHIRKSDNTVKINCDSQNASSAVRCKAVLLAGPIYERGASAFSFSKIACSSILCIGCNFKVLQFPKKSWKYDIDSLFFRLNYLNSGDALLSALVDDEGTCAYCCQCRWVSVHDESPVALNGSIMSIAERLPWVCAGHY